MHFFIDENIGSSLAKALNHLADICDENHTVLHAWEVNGGPGTPDTVWLEKLRREGNWVVISKDRFKKGDPERVAFENAGLPIINLGKDWNKRNGWGTAVQLIRWWPTISREMLRTPGPMHYELPWGLVGKLKGRKLPKP